MIQEFVDKYMSKKEAFIAGVMQAWPESYADIMKRVVESLVDEGAEYGIGSPDPSRITCIDHGDYQGTQVFVVGNSGYQPSKYWATSESYGSCSGCDTLQAIESDLEWDDSYSKRVVTPEAATDIWTLGLHLVQRMREVCG